MADEKKRTASEKTATDGTETINGHLVVVREPNGMAKTVPRLASVLVTEN